MSKKSCESCCCLSLCQVSDHGRKLVSVEDLSLNTKPEVDHGCLLDKSWQEFDEYEEDILSYASLERDPLVSLLTAVNMDFSH